MEERAQHERWVNRKKARYSYGEVLDALREIAERRSARGYERAG